MCPKPKQWMRRSHTAVIEPLIERAERCYKQSPASQIPTPAPMWLSKCALHRRRRLSCRRTLEGTNSRERLNAPHLKDLANTLESPRKVAFAGARPPEVLWHGRGRLESLFRWISALLLAGPEHVLDCERTHVRWQWLCRGEKALRLPSLDASSRPHTIWMVTIGSPFLMRPSRADRCESSQSTTQVAGPVQLPKSGLAPCHCEGSTSSFGFKARIHIRTHTHTYIHKTNNPRVANGRSAHDRVADRRGREAPQPNTCNAAKRQQGYRFGRRVGQHKLI